MEGTSGLSAAPRTKRSARPVDSHAARTAESQCDFQKSATWIDPEYQSTLEKHGIANFTQMMATTAGRQLRALNDRENWRLDLAHPAGRRGAFLKKHHIRTFGTRLRATLGWGAGSTAGRIEATNIARLEQGGVAAMHLIAFGEQLHRDGRLESYVLTEELSGYVQLDDFLQERFARTGARLRQQESELRSLCRRIADLASRFHRLGYNHRDFYCCHFFIREPNPGDFLVNLIDLQRVERRTRFRKRWIVKDLAQLAYSAPREYVTCSQKLRFIKHYLGVQKLRAADKRLIRRVVAKQRIMEWQLGKNS